VRPDGVIITNQHVVAGAESIAVTLPDGTNLPGRLVGEDPTTDIAVVRVDRTGLPVVPLGTSSDLMIGEWVVALGDPYGFLLGNNEPTVTAGVVSATHRNILPNDEQPGLYLDMIQTDAAINRQLRRAAGQCAGRGRRSTRSSPAGRQQRIHRARLCDSDRARPAGGR
jgi:serine protease Do